MRNERNIKEMLAMGVLKVNKSVTPKPPTHAWNWDTFRDLVEVEDSITVRRSLINSVAQDVSSDDSPILSSNDSPVQTPVSLSPEQSPVRPQQDDDVHYEQHRVEYTQDTPRRSLRFVGNNTNWATYDAFGEK